MERIGLSKPEADFTVAKLRVSRNQLGEIFPPYTILETVDSDSLNKNTGMLVVSGRGTGMDGRACVRSVPAALNPQVANVCERTVKIWPLENIFRGIALGDARSISTGPSHAGRPDFYQERGRYDVITRWEKYDPAV